ncbi:biotin transporter BioY [Pseudooceanicola sp. CBS1P-1]|uniref:Biotin transporter n=1 Tax=Pseudooceanicola albus TaxID=2692189 RepID=A0A6L7GD85_9RHOB|nr:MULTISPECIES: biotin transporter BioY [Pseudooceanicola]MBT9386987.1 biotin transporter BioY [Pseudooceanicola endophyticus]MXN21200.1 biotin transporter BioY [Pseudooceanicola albus]
MAHAIPARTRSGPFWRDLALVLGGAALITLAAKVQIPFWPVPMTLHSLAVFFLAASLGPRRGLAAVSAYLAAGSLGLPVFSGTPERGIGLAYMAGPTGGYLLGYLLAAPLTGVLARGRGLIGRGLAMLAGLTVVYLCGLAWLASFVPLSGVLAAGFTPFILGDLVKLALASGLISGLRRLWNGRQ